jgi:hypothetical protein
MREPANVGMDDSLLAKLEIAQEDSRRLRDEARAFLSALREQRALLRLARADAASTLAELIAKRADQLP